MTAPTSPDTIGADECAELLRCTVAQAEELARAGDIPGLKLGRSWIFVRADLLAFLAERARAEAEVRRSKRAGGAKAPTSIKGRRREPPPLPAVPQATQQ